MALFSCYQSDARRTLKKKARNNILQRECGGHGRSYHKSVPANEGDQTNAGQLTITQNGSFSSNSKRTPDFNLEDIGTWVRDILGDKLLAGTSIEEEC